MTEITSMIDPYTLAIVSIAVTIIFGIIGMIPLINNFYRNRQEYIKASKNLQIDIEGKWYSAELDLKQDNMENAILEVEIKRRKSGNEIEITTGRQLGVLNGSETAWVANGRVVAMNTLLLDWTGSTGSSIRYGNAFLQFIEKNRAVGYWLGYASYKTYHPVYGYWILSRKEDDLLDLAQFALSKFIFVDVKELIEDKANIEKRRGSYIRKGS